MDTRGALESAGGSARSSPSTLTGARTSNIAFTVRGHQVLVPLTVDRVKVRDLRGDPRALLHVTERRLLLDLSVRHGSGT